MGAGLQQSPPFPVQDHRRADPALDAEGGVPPFDLGGDRRAESLRKAMDRHQRRPADRFEVVAVDTHGVVLSVEE